MTRDIPFDEECPERSDTYREQVGEPCSLADLESARRRMAANLDAADRLARREAGYLDALECDRREESLASGKALDQARLLLREARQDMMRAGKDDAHGRPQRP